MISGRHPGECETEVPSTNHPDAERAQIRAAPPLRLKSPTLAFQCKETLASAASLNGVSHPTGRSFSEISGGSRRCGR
jgi:hypothetical protein